MNKGARSLLTLLLFIFYPLLLRLFFYPENYPEQVCKYLRTFDNYYLHM